MTDKTIIVSTPPRVGKCLMQELREQMAKDSQEIAQRIADYDTFIWYCTEFRGMDLESANYCWRHRND